MSEPATSPPLFEERPLGESTCARRLVMDPPTNCASRATWHVVWNGATMENGIVCDEHYAEAKERWSPWDSHPFGGFCTMPGVDWIASWEDPPGACVFPLSDEGVQDVLVAALEFPTAIGAATS